MRVFLPIAIFSFFLAAGFYASAQQSTKIDLYTRQMLRSQKYSRSNSTINLFVRGNKDAVAAAAEKSGGYFKYNYGDLSAVNIPVNTLDTFLNNPAVLKAENGDVPMKRLCDSAILSNHVMEVQLGDSPLTQPYKGDGVVIGIIDGGVDFHHHDFKNPDGTTRIQYIWDQNNSGANPPVPYGYGQEWTFQDINAGICTEIDATDDFGHGTHVTGIAAGNGSAANHYTGMAPDATIIEVCINEGNGFLSYFVDACDYIFKKAAAMGMPCVINASVGTYFGSHDGTDFAAQMVNQMLEQKNGRSLVAALGNAGQQKLHLGYNVTSDTSFTWFEFNNDNDDVYWEAWGDSAALDSVYFSVGADDPGSNTYIGNIGFHNILTDYPGITSTDSAEIVNYILYQGTTYVATCSTQVTKYSAGLYSIEVFIQPQEDSYLWRFITTGKGRIDAWSSSSFISGTSDMVATAPDTSVDPSYVNYVAPDTLETLVSSFTCSSDVISVGNFVNRTSYIACSGDSVSFPEYTTGSLFKDDNPDVAARLGSSYGPTRDGRLKPDISAPGGIVIATGDSATIADAIASGNPANYDKVAFTCLHWRNSGTSMSSPMVAGAVALYLQRYPNASYRDIKEAFISTARKDSFTTDTPNIAFGYGKLDCFAAVQKYVHYGCTDTGAINYDSTANYDDGTCIAKVYGCMDPDANNYNAQANVATPCEYTGIAAVKNQEPTLSVNPNPSSGNSTISYSIPPSMMGTAHIMFTDLLGRIVSDIPLQDGQGNIIYQSPAKGVYIYYLQSGNQVYARNKLIIF